MATRPYRVGAARWAIFNLVGAAGLLVQLGCLWLLTDGLGVPYAVALLAAVELTILHNFVWHVRWTWADRPSSVPELLRRLARFNLTNGAISIVGNLVLMIALVELARLHYLVANLVSVSACSLANFVVGDAVVFRDRRIAAPLAVLCTSIGWLAAAAPANAADLRAETVAAFERYVLLTETRMGREMWGSVPFLWLDRLPAPESREVYARLRRGEIVVSRPETRDGAGVMEVPDGMCHHWVGTIFVPDATLDRSVTLMQSYDRYQDIYRPAVRRSRTLSRAGDRFAISLQLFTKKVVGIVVNTEYEVSYIRVAPTRMFVRSRSTRVAEVEHPGTPSEREKPVGHDNGFLWRFNNYCSLEERREGVYIQCESVSLTRDIPTGLGWLIGPFVTSIPRESLEFTLGTMRTALRKDR
ncbi:MAG: GtrA family protein [Acidobacteria bacterium]|nr:GtrA family protein [Acidobacteriota bacterium]